MNSRKNGWTIEQDELLLNTVLDFTRKGEKLNIAISIVCNKVNRSYEAVYVRWNSKIKKKNQEMYDLALKECFEAGGESTFVDLSEDDELTIGEIMHYISLIESKMDTLTKENQSLLNENASLRAQNLLSQPTIVTPPYPNHSNVIPFKADFQNV